jgi:hypothetical protein
MTSTSTEKNDKGTPRSRRLAKLGEHLQAFAVMATGLPDGLHLVVYDGDPDTSEVKAIVRITDIDATEYTIGRKLTPASGGRWGISERHALVAAELAELDPNPDTNLWRDAADGSVTYPIRLRAADGTATTAARQLLEAAGYRVAPRDAWTAPICTCGRPRALPHIVEAWVDAGAAVDCLAPNDLASVVARAERRRIEELGLCWTRYGARCNTRRVQVAAGEDIRPGQAVMLGADGLARRAPQFTLAPADFAGQRRFITASNLPARGVEMGYSMHSPGFEIDVPGDAVHRAMERLAQREREMLLEVAKPRDLDHWAGAGSYALTERGYREGVATLLAAQPEVDAEAIRREFGIRQPFTTHGIVCTVGPDAIVNTDDSRPGWVRVVIDDWRRLPLAESRLAEIMPAGITLELHATNAAESLARCAINLLGWLDALEGVYHAARRGNAEVGGRRQVHCGGTSMWVRAELVAAERSRQLREGVARADAARREAEGRRSGWDPEID